MALHTVSNGRTWNVSREGAGPPLVVLHGFTGRASELLEVARAAAPEREIIGVDLPGHGDTDWGEDPEHHAFDEVATSLEQLVDDIVPSRFDLWGYSLGGRLALALAARAPQRIRALVLESCSAGLTPEESRTERADRDRALARVLLDRGIAAFVDVWESQPLFASERALPALEREEIRSMRLANEPRRLAAALLGLSPARQTPLWSELGSLRVPTLVLTGELDAKYQALAARLCSGLRDSRHISIAGAGHAPHRERPEETARALRDFLREGDSLW